MTEFIPVGSRVVCVNDRYGVDKGRQGTLIHVDYGDATIPYKVMWDGKEEYEWAYNDEVALASSAETTNFKIHYLDGGERTVETTSRDYARGFADAANALGFTARVTTIKTIEEEVTF